jgi:methyl-accepting chemotaxis protein
VKRGTHARRAIIVKHAFNRRLIMRIWLILMTLVLVSGVAFYLLAQKRLAEEYFSAHSQIRTTMEMLLPWMIIVYVLGILVTFFLTVFYTRKLAGPVLRFQREMDQLAAGDYGVRINLRKGDELKELASRINIIAELTEERFRRLRELQERIREELKELETNDLSRQDALRDLEKTLREMDEVFAKIKFPER